MQSVNRNGDNSPIIERENSYLETKLTEFLLEAKNIFFPALNAGAVINDAMYYSSVYTLFRRKIKWHVRSKNKTIILHTSGV